MINKDIVFTERPSSIPFGYNLSYKSALICLSLKFNSEPRKSCSLIKIQLILTKWFEKSARCGILEENFMPGGLGK